METYTQYIELINDYINNVLSKEARVDVESKLKSDTAFNTVYQEHIIFLNGLERIKIKDDILNAKRSYHTEKWLKISGISILAIGVLVMLYTLVFNTSETEPAPNSDTLNTIIIDTTSNSKTTTFSNAEPIEDSIASTKITKAILVATTPISEEKLIAKANYNPFQKQHQILKVNTQNDTVIKCKEGTVLRIAKGSFVHSKTGKAIVGNVDIKVTEYYKLSDILLANLSTASHGQQLETGGMLFIEAKQGATDLKLKDSSPIKISFPTINKKNGMQLFTGEWTNKNINWSLQNDNSVDDLLVFETQEESPTNQSLEPVNMDTVSTFTSIAFDQRAISHIEMDTIYSDNRGMVEFIREVMHDKDFPVDSLFINEWELYKTQKLIRSISIETKPNYIERAIILRKPLLEMEGSKFKILDDDSITRGGHIIRVPWDESKIPTTTQVMTIAPKRRFSAGTEAVTAEEFESRIVDVTDRTVSSRDAGYYILRTSNLGWINCDRFINGRTKRIKYKLKIKNADGASISMVFKSINSVLPSWYTNNVYDFQTVGANEEVVLVAIKRKDGKLYYDMVDTKTKVNPQLDFKFKEITIEELKNELEKLNSNFN